MLVKIAWTMFLILVSIPILGILGMWGYSVYVDFATHRLLEGVFLLWLPLMLSSGMIILVKS